MKKVFADTFYFLALLNKHDAGHGKAVEYASRVEQLVTTEWVLTELANGLARSRRRDMFPRTRQELLDDADVSVVSLDMKLHEEGIKLFVSRSDKEWSLTDCISFVVMQRKGITEALTGDHHFEQAGFVALLK
ncbi:MAG TPA: PIN domain-containing protein [Gemmataceae bacterium]|nr:PIN domain-containing protein [Gemmataceae bacterium]